MGILDANGALRGIIGPVIVRKGKKKGTSIVQSAPEQVKQSRGTKRTGNLFGIGSSLAATIRTDLTYLIDTGYDSPMINRFSTPVQEVIRQCFVKKTRSFNFREESFQRLVGFEFNAKSLLIDSLLVYPKTSLIDGVLTISIPEFEVPAQLKFPLSANRCKISVVVTQIVLDQQLHWKLPAKSVEVDIKQGLVPAKEFSFEVAPGCLVVAGIGLKYSDLKDGVREPKNSLTFNPVNVCAAVVTPGEFVAPPLLDEHGKRKSPWLELRTLSNSWKKITGVKNGG